MRLFAIAGVMLAAGCGASPAIAAERTNWSTGPTLKRQLESRIGITWSGTPLRQAIGNLSKHNAVAVLIDRRVDPSQEMELSLADTPLRDAFDRIAADRKLGVAMLGPVAYFGPLWTARRLRTVATLRREEIPGLMAEKRKLLGRTRAWSWPDLAEPRALLEQLAAEGGFTIEGVEQVPHDLWAGADLPALALGDRLTLLLAQFDLTYSYQQQGAAIAIQPITEDVAIERRFPAGADPEKQVAKWRALLPDSSITIADGKLVVRGLLEDMERIDVVRKGSSVATKVTGPVQTAYTLTIRDQPLEPLLKQLAKKLMLDIRIEQEACAAAGISLDMKISFTVKDVPLDKLLSAALEPAGLTFRREDTVVHVSPGETADD